MRLGSLWVQDLRSVAHAQLPLAQDFTLVTGGNGQGKTNLLEAVHLCATLRPMTTSTPQELVRWNTPRAVVQGQLVGGVLPLAVRVVVEGSRRRAWVGGKPLRDAEGYTGTLPTVSFTPDDLGLVKQGPAARRQFFGRAAAELWPAARDEARRLDRCLRQRAAALRRGAAQDVLDALEQPLVQACINTWRRRAQALAIVQPYAAGWATRLLGGAVLQTRLRPGLPDGADGLDGSDADLDQALRQALAASLEEDRRRCTTSAGPHHDEVELLLDGVDARRFASQGQQRCVALALTLAVVDAVHHARAIPPLVLLDDVSSELDADRRSALFLALADGGCQVVATATDPSLLPLPPGFTGELAHYRAQGGKFSVV